MIFERRSPAACYVSVLRESILHVSLEYSTRRCRAGRRRTRAERGQGDGGIIAVEKSNGMCRRSWHVAQKVASALLWPAMQDYRTNFDKESTPMRTGRNRLAALLAIGLIWGMAGPTLACDDLEGLTPGFWKNHAEAWVQYSPDDSFNTVFGVGPDRPLMKVLRTGGGGDRALGRHAVAALLNIAHPGIDYAMSHDDLMAAVQAVYGHRPQNEWLKDVLDDFNNMGADFD
jgi:hypothetical protein